MKTNEHARAMVDPGERTGDARLASAVSRVLSIGTALAVFMIAIGIVIYLLQRGGEPLSFRVFPTAETGTSPSIWSWGGIKGMDGRAMMMTGVMLLILTPVCRVALSFFRYTANRERALAAVSLAVLVILIIGFV